MNQTYLCGNPTVCLTLVRSGLYRRTRFGRLLGLGNRRYTQYSGLYRCCRTCENWSTFFDLFAIIQSFRNKPMKFFRRKKSRLKLERILKKDNTTEAIIELDSWVNELSNYGEDLSKLTKSQQILLFVENLEREVNNGGFHQFYWNSSGAFAHETHKGLITIGAKKAAEILLKANSEWPNQLIPQK